MTKIREGRNAIIRKYQINLFCDCGGKMYYTTKSIDGYHIDMIVKCEKCNKLSTVELTFNNYEMFKE